jgi:hypothetical protein
VNARHYTTRLRLPSCCALLLMVLHVATAASAPQVEALPLGVVADEANIGYFNSPIQSFGAHIYVAFVEPQPGGRHRTRVGKWDGKAWSFATVEEHSIIGGLGSAVAEVLSALPNHAPLLRLGVRDVFGESALADELLEKHGLQAGGIRESILAALRG